MTPLSIQSEPYGSHGSISASGAARLLGKPELDPLELLIRETVQNSWDARISGGGPPTYEITSRSLSEAQAHVLRNVVFGVLPACSASAELIAASLSGEVKLLQVADFGTVGLGGPVVPSEPPAGRSTDYVDFICNLGSPRDTILGGGTYGYGKSSLYSLSECATILVDTWSVEDNERRLICAHLGARFDGSVNGDPCRFTGRHWWGAKDGGPVTGDAATAIADGLGLPKRSRAESGTTVCVLAPLLEEEDDQGQALDPVRVRINEALLWHFWPKMLRNAQGEPSMHFRVFDQDYRHRLVRPEDAPPFNLYARAMRQLKEGEDTRVIRCRKPDRELGRLAFVEDAMAPRVPGFSRRFESPARSVALMRPAELVVRYLPGVEAADGREWAGVFICDAADDVERAFAQSEPPAHDDWVPRNLPARSPQKRLVNVGLREIKKAIRSRGGTASVDETTTAEGGGLGKLARTLGRALGTTPGSEGGGRKKPVKPTGGGARKRGVQVELLDIAGEGEQIVSTWEISGLLRVDAASDGVLAIPEFLLVGGRKARTLPGQPSPEVVGWYKPDGTPIVVGPAASLDALSDTAWVKLRCSQEFAVALKVEARATGGAP